MPNADCTDLVVSVSRVEFGRTVAEIYVSIHGIWRRPIDQWAEAPHDTYVREARAAGNETYVDLDEVFYFPAMTEIVSEELQRRLGLVYTPVIRSLREIGRRKRTFGRSAPSGRDAKARRR